MEEKKLPFTGREKIRFNVPPFTGREYEYVRQAVENQKLCGDGEFTKKASHWFEEKTGTAKCLMTTSCTHATELAAILADIKPGDTGITFSSNKNKSLTLADKAINPVTGELFSLSTLNMGGLGDARFLLKEGGSMGDLYSLRDMKRDANGQIFVDQNGAAATETITDPDKYIKLGSVLPKGNLAWRNNFIWKNFTAGFLISARLGGVVYSRTQAMLDYYGVSEASADARDL